MAESFLSRAQKDSADLNMTPMIDCVFQLIIFFMVVTEIKKSDDAEVQLPRTRYVEHETQTPPNRVVISCTAAAGVPGGGMTSGPAGGAAGDRIEIRSRIFTGSTLETYLKKMDRENRVLERRAPVGDASDWISHLYVNIRADARCEWTTVRQVQLACMNAGIYRLSYGTQPAERQP